MASIITCVATSAAWCFCTATGSLLSACCGNDKASHMPPSATSGRKRSVLLLIITIALAFAFQYALAPFLLNGVPISNYFTSAWTDGCTDIVDEALQLKCVGNQGVFRATSSALIFFLLAAVAAACKPTANREAWPAKYVLFLFLVLAMCCVPNQPFFSDVYIHIARTGAVLFVLAEQVIILDMAYNWNDSWVERANSAETEALGQRWLGAILMACAILFAISLVAVGLLFAYFSGCPTNTTFIVLTLIFNIFITLLQLSGEEASLLASATIAAYGSYLCYIAVSKNPNGTCNPMLGETDSLGIILGIGFTVMSLAWTGYSMTADKTVNGNSDDEESTPISSAYVNDNGVESSRKVQGVVMAASNSTEKEDLDEGHAEARSSSNNNNNDSAGSDATAASGDNKPVSWKLNLVLAVVSCWIAVALTGWGSIEAGGNAANPGAGQTSMWMIIASQWIMYTLYAWTLAAPRLFPDRDFS